MLDQSERSDSAFESANILLYLAGEIWQINSDWFGLNDRSAQLVLLADGSTFLRGGFYYFSTMPEKIEYGTTAFAMKPNANWTYWTRN